MLLQMARFCSFLWSSSIPLCICTTSSLSVHLQPLCFLMFVLFQVLILGVPSSWPGKSHGRRSLVGYRPQGHKESDMTEQLHFHFHFILALVSFGCDLIIFVCSSLLSDILMFQARTGPSVPLSRSLRRLGFS